MWFTNMKIIKEIKDKLTQTYLNIKSKISLYFTTHSYLDIPEGELGEADLMQYVVENFNDIYENRVKIHLSPQDKLKLFTHKIKKFLKIDGLCNEISIRKAIRCYSK